MNCGKKRGLVLTLVVCLLVLVVTAVLYSLVPIAHKYYIQPALSVITVTEDLNCTQYENVSLPRHVVVRSVYFDGRPHQNGHRNSSVFLVEVRITILKQKGIVGCAVIL